MGAGDGSDRHTVTTDKDNSAARKTLTARCSSSFLIFLRLPRPLRTDANLQVGSAAIVRNSHDHAMMCGIEHRRPGVYVARHQLVGRVRVPAINLNSHLAPPGMIVPLVPPDVHLH